MTPHGTEHEQGAEEITCTLPSGTRDIYCEIGARLPQRACRAEGKDTRSVAEL